MLKLKVECLFSMCLSICYNSLRITIPNPHMKNVLHKEIMERWLSRSVSIELLACLYIGHEKREREKNFVKPWTSLYICHGKNEIEWWKTIMYGYIRRELLLKLKLNLSLRCIEIKMYNVGVKNVSVEGKIGNYFWNLRCIERRTHNVLVKNVSVEGKIGNYFWNSSLTQA